MNRDKTLMLKFATQSRKLASRGSTCRDLAGLASVAIIQAAAGRDVADYVSAQSLRNSIKPQ
jgi:hypothetical protein